ncbi:MAG: glutamate synthase subunit alpha, partial [Candidatus Hydrogenedentota bacterium]
MRGLPEKQGLYDPAFEHDACGVGFIVDISGKKSHDIVEKGLRIVENLSHRGACGCDPRTGDGAGILMQIPDEFFRKECANAHGFAGGRGFELPPLGQYGVGMIFLPQIPVDRHFCEGLLEEIIEQEGLDLLGWRSVPIVESVIGEFAKDVRPHIKQVFVASSDGNIDQDALERKLYVVRKRMQNEVRDKMKRAFHYFYIASLSTRTIVYKGMLIAEQIQPFFLDL